MDEVKSSIKTYALLTKPGIIMGNLIAIAGGFALGMGEKMAYGLLLLTMLGLGLMIASSCVLNNFIDRRIDALMERTRKRAMVLGLISARKALFFAAVLGIAGLILLIKFTNHLTVAVALFGYITYVVIYGFYKRRTHYGTLVGSLAGAVPPVVGYCAATNCLDLGALLLFALLIVWQMPHFFAIALYRLDDYARASLPVHPLKKGVLQTKIQMLLYVAAFGGIALLLIPYAGWKFALVLSILCLYWLGTAVRGFRKKEYAVWARQMFFASLWAICGLFLSLVVLRG